MTPPKQIPQEIPKEIPKEIPGLTITSTPIGNLDDLSPRAAQSLKTADIIACEDSRHTGMMLKRLGITPKKLQSYHEHSPAQTREKLLTAMQDGKAVTLVSDAGTPLISDPGYRLVKACRTRSIPITAIPGPSALLTALVASGLPTDRFYFAGFLPHTSKKRQTTLATLMPLDASIICYESAKRLTATLSAIASIAPTRLCYVGRELTKRFEQSWLMRAADLAAYFKNQGAPKGEVVLIIAPPPNEKPVLDDATLIALLRTERKKGASRRDAVRAVAAATATNKARVYALMLGLESP